MRILQLRSFGFALGALATAGVAVLLAAPQMMPRPNPGMARPQMSQMPPGAMGGAMNAARFGHMPFNMMAQPGMAGRSSYGMGSYGMGSMGPGYGQGGMSGAYGYGAQGGGSQGMPYEGGGVQTSPEEKSLSRILKAAGLPHEDGQLRWPVGLRVLGGAGADELREQIDALLQEGGEQARAGPANANLAQELTRATDALRQLFVRERDERGSLPQTTYEDAERFLAKLDRAAKLLGAGLESPGGKAKLEAREGGANEVGLHDNRFDPPTVTDRKSVV